MNKLLAALVCAFAASAVSAATYEVFITGPGGHSNGSYGNTNAVTPEAEQFLNLKKRFHVPSLPTLRAVLR